MDIELSKSLSGEDILNELNYKCNLVQYRDLKNYDNINDLLGKYKKCVLLYHTKRNYGHWTCLYEHDNIIYFFDSYGIIPDDELKFLHKDLKHELNSQHRHLTKLLYNQNKPVEYNEYQLQERKPNIATCGRWVILRLKYPSISVDDFYNNFKFSKKYISNDKLICLLIK
tara:strand:+ start:1500 stop:2009 length:510 start_codon:yes stop_codon:yes gene_type:complete